MKIVGNYKRFDNLTTNYIIRELAKKIFKHSDLHFRFITIIRLDFNENCNVDDIIFV